MRTEEEIRAKFKEVKEEMKVFEHTKTWNIKGKAWIETFKWVLNDKGEK